MWYLEVEIAVIDSISHAVRKRFRLEPETIVLVGRLAEHRLFGGTEDGLLVGHSRVGFGEFNTRKLLQVVQENFQVQFSRTCYNHLPCCLL